MVLREVWDVFRIAAYIRLVAIASNEAVKALHNKTGRKTPHASTNASILGGYRNCGLLIFPIDTMRLRQATISLPDTC